MSRNVVVQYLLLFIAVFITSVIRWTCSMVACFCLKPNWWSGIIRFSCKIGWILVSKSFSSNFERVGSKLIGL
jgi:hypothetical protein